MVGKLWSHSYVQEEFSQVRTQAKYVCIHCQDKLASLGWPVTQTLATNMLTTPMPSIDPEHSDFLCGNSMHVSNCAIVMLVALCCFGYDPRMI